MKKINKKCNRIASRRSSSLLIGVVMIIFVGLTLIPTVSAAEHLLDRFYYSPSDCAVDNGDSMFRGWYYYEDTSGNETYACWNDYEYTSMKKVEGASDLSKLKKIYTPTYLDMGGSSFKGVKITAARESLYTEPGQSVMLYFNDSGNREAYHHFELSSSWQTFTINKDDSWDHYDSGMDWANIKSISIHGHDYDSGSIDTDGGYYIKWKDFYYITDTTPLTSDVSAYVDLSTERDFSFYVENSKWAVAGIRLTDGDDHDIMVDDDPNFGSDTYSEGGSTIPDFVVINGHNYYGTYYARVYYLTSPGHSATIEVEDDTTYRLSVGTGRSDSMDTDEVNEMYEAYLTANKEYKITLDITSGSADLDLYLYATDVDIDNRISATKSSTSGGGGQDEVIGSYTPSTSGYVGIVVVHDGDSSDSAGYTLTVEEITNNPPDTPSSPSPADGTTGVSISTDLSWTGGDQDGDTVYYDVYFGTSSPPSLVSTGQTTTIYDPGTLSYTTIYYWKIIAKDSNDAITEGQEWSFTTESGGGDCEGIYLKNRQYQITNNNLGEVKDFLTFLKNWASPNFNSIDVDIYAFPEHPDCTYEETAEFQGPFSASKYLTLERAAGEEEFIGNYIYPQDAEPVGEKTELVKKELEDLFFDILSKWYEKSGTYNPIPVVQVISKVSAAVTVIIPTYPPEIYLNNFILKDESMIAYDDPLKDPDEPFENHPELLLPSYLPNNIRNFIFSGAWSPVDILIIDPDGNRVGTIHQNGSISEINELGNKSFYAGNETEPAYILIQDPKVGNYTLEVVGTANGKYDLDVSMIINGSVSDETFQDVSILKDEKHIYYLKYGLQEARIYSFMYGTYYSPGETVSARIYVENIGGGDIDDELIFTIIGPSGERIYKKRKPTYLEADEMLSFKFNGDIPSDVSKGHYWLRIEFDDLDIDFLPLTESFWVD